MSIFTGSELEFLAGLNKSWWRLYWREFSRLRRIEAVASTGATAAPAERDVCSDDPACAIRERARDPVRRCVELAALNR